MKLRVLKDVQVLTFIITKPAAYLDRNHYANRVSPNAPDLFLGAYIPNSSSSELLLAMSARHFLLLSLPDTRIYV